MISDSNPNAFDGAKGCGQQLREAREAAGLSIDDVGGRLRMPVHVVQALESEQWQRLGAPVFVRGQLRSYARLLGVDLEPLLQTAQIAPVQPVELISHTHTPPLRRMLESATRRMVYVVITAGLAVPVWYATRSHFADDGGPSTASLDVVPGAPGSPAAATATPVNGTAAAAVPAAPAAARPAANTAPYIASLTPMPRPAQEAEPEKKGLSLSFQGDSWVQVLAPDGTPVEKALLKAGESRTYAPGQVGRVVLGNASAVQVQQAGSTVDLTPFRRANVARFAVSSDGSVVPASE
ncbi:cytoskeleton protein RodZ [Xanthomonas sacchari]|uniref:helix-turn-helix domain-containing protein n=1 Tax=Xanthomonas sacchari TaxID=56458 RepID=UPI0020C5544B|nr:RodZ domain-containing protein [Xanthomonas sacchari]MDQ1093081.1 cytoskeleton protein RodZ [Xanthomonas sacchari]